MIGRQQAAALGDDAVAVVIGIAGKRNVEFVFQSDQALHGVGRGGIHANFAVPIHGHESKRGIDGFVHNRQIEAVPLGNHRPVINARAAERVDAERDLGIANRRHIDDAFEIADIGVQVVVSMRGRGSKRLREQHSLDALERAPQKFVGLRFDPGRYVRIGRSAVRRIVFEATVVRGIVRRRDDDAVGKAGFPSAVVTQNRVGNGGSRRVGGAFRKHHLDIVGREHFQRAGKCRLGQRVRVHSEEERPVNFLLVCGSRKSPE